MNGTEHPGMRAGVLPIILSAWLSLAAAGLALAEDGPVEPGATAAPPSIVVEGTAAEAVRPDTALVTLGVEALRPHPIDAVNETSRIVAAVIEAVKAQGIAERDVETQAVSLEPVYEPPPPTRDVPPPRKITGFHAGQRLQIRVRPVDSAGRLLGVLLDKGANQIDSVVFVAPEDAARDDRLRGDAMRDARHKAEVYAGALGLHLGRILDITPAEGSPPQLLLRSARQKMSLAAEAVPLATGETVRRAAVFVTFEIKP